MLNFIRLIPIVNNAICYGFGFLFAAQIAALGGSGWQVALPALAAGAVYPLTVWLVSRIATGKRLAPLIAAGGVCIFFASAGALFVRTIPMFVVWNALVSVALSLSGVPIQLLMKRMQRGGNASAGTVRTISLYLVGVSVGQGLGTYVCGVVTYTLFGVVSAMLGLGVAALALVAGKRYPAEAETPSAPKPDGGTPGKTKIPWSVVSGWVIVGLISLSLSQMTPAVAFHGNVVGLSKKMCADVLSLRSLCEGVLVLALYFSRRWMDKKAAAPAIALVLTASLVGFALGKNYAAFAAAAVLYGIGLALGLFYIYYHALASSGSNGKYSFVTEIVIGVTQFLGPVCGATATYAHSARPFYIAAAAMAAGGLFLVLYGRKKAA